ncbi:NADH:ubiquinone oxidoreductase subunit NDUFA12 [Rhizomicrobium electricum]|jgi:NADH:ubiquinone oxidoreductase subunit|uniref:NADH:ubiquinone oxidoreductase subunit NDUFA12 n=1 Tax=Rhizomicrobium electricum TaxID=480070 RepID=A0ABP3P337_9PROT|nr:NADH:ubiquinone oxidoreductase subunit NDUFA12 [Rhizomicrobium electricum]NIJ47675.1 NADH:ubiquinone oxidoreductase subunit [Rhizomicrobium electricum]
MASVWTYMKMVFGWWNHATYGTLLYTARKGVPVGTDSFGNRYYQTADGKRRWVLYNGTVEGSRVPAEWHLWMHHTVDTPPAADMTKKSWEQDFLPNLSGTEGAYHPKGSLVRGGVRAPATGDYESWSPNA